MHAGWIISWLTWQQHSASCHNPQFSGDQWPTRWTTHGTQCKEIWSAHYGKCMDIPDEKMEANCRSPVQLIVEWGSHIRSFKLSITSPLLLYNLATLLKLTNKRIQLWFHSQIQSIPIQRLSPRVIKYWYPSLNHPGSSILCPRVVNTNLFHLILTKESS